jgi:transcriptional regulator with XRE-family HTH domain
MSDQRFGVRLAELRRAKGWSQEGLARAAGLSTSAVTKLEQGITLPGWETLCGLADALGCSLDDFRGRRGRKH